MIFDYLTYGFYDEIEKLAAVKHLKFLTPNVRRNFSAGAAQTVGGMAVQRALTPSERKQSRRDEAQGDHGVGESRYA